MPLTQNDRKSRKAPLQLVASNRDLPIRPPSPTCSLPPENGSNTSVATLSAQRRHLGDKLQLLTWSDEDRAFLEWLEAVVDVHLIRRGGSRETPTPPAAQAQRTAERLHPTPQWGWRGRP